jgi:hypothetical protein
MSHSSGSASQYGVVRDGTETGCDSVSGIDPNRPVALLRGGRLGVVNESRALYGRGTSVKRHGYD